jgi:prevent-host-death family protein
MGNLNIHAAKTHLSRLIEEVGEGEEIVIAKAGRPVARLVPIEKPTKRKLGILKGKLTIPASFDDPLPDDVIASFEGR